MILNAYWINKLTLYKKRKCEKKYIELAIKRAYKNGNNYVICFPRMMLDYYSNPKEDSFSEKTIKYFSKKGFIIEERDSSIKISW